jgi:hypothetical protein
MDNIDIPLDEEEIDLDHNLYKWNQGAINVLNVWYLQAEIMKKCHELAARHYYKKDSKLVPPCIVTATLTGAVCAFTPDNVIWWKYVTFGSSTLATFMTTIYRECGFKVSATEHIKLSQMYELFSLRIQQDIILFRVFQDRLDYGKLIETLMQDIKQIRTHDKLLPDLLSIHTKLKEYPILDDELFSAPSLGPSNIEDMIDSKDKSDIGNKFGRMVSKNMKRILRRKRSSATSHHKQPSLFNIPEKKDKSMEELMKGSMEESEKSIDDHSKSIRSTPRDVPIVIDIDSDVTEPDPHSHPLEQTTAIVIDDTITDTITDTIVSDPIIGDNDDDDDEHKSG